MTQRMLRNITKTLTPQSNADEHHQMQLPIHLEVLQNHIS